MRKKLSFGKLAMDKKENCNYWKDQTMQKVQLFLNKVKKLCLYLPKALFK